jgi:general secretion pathway protein F
VSSPRQYRFRAATADGRLIDGTLAAASERAALESLEERALVPVELTLAADAGPHTRRAARVSSRMALQVWARTMATMLDAGIPLDRALAFAGENLGAGRVAAASARLREGIQRGEPLSGAMRATSDVFTPVVIAMAAAGEEAGALDAAFARIAAYLEEQDALRERLRSALSYPALLAVVAGAAVLVLMLFVVPRFAAMLQELGGELPLSTRLLLGVSDVLVSGWWLATLAVIVTVVLARRWLAAPPNRERWDAARLRWPLAGRIEEGFEVSRFLASFSTLLESGATVLAALRGARAAVVNRALGRRVEQAVEDVRRGRAIASAMSGVLPPIALELLAAGEESGRLSSLADRAARRIGDDAQRALHALVRFVEPALILLFGALVAFVALAMLQAIYSVNAASIIR